MNEPVNSAAWQPEPGTVLKIGPSPYTAPGDHEIVVRNAALAINPVDWILQDQALFDWLTYPIILGSDVAGVVVEVGSSVDRFKPGDRVLGQCTGATSNDSARSAFQYYTVVADNLAAHLPADMPFEHAVVLPLGLGTAACGLFEKDQLALPHPTLSPKPTGQVLLVWGGASSVGCNGIQLAVAAGCKVVATASPKNFDLLKRLGASQVFDYTSETVVDDLVAALEGKTIAGALNTAGDAVACCEVVARCNGRRFVSTTLAVPEGKPANVEANRIFGSTLKDNEVGQAVYGDFLGEALARGSYVAAPEPWVVGSGLEALQAGFEAQKKGVSAKKVVITLE